VGGDFSVRDINGDNYTVGSHGGNYTAVLYAWGDNYHSVSELTSSESLVLLGARELSVTLLQYGEEEGGGQWVAGRWSFRGDACEPGDVLLVVPVDHRGRGRRVLLCAVLYCAAVLCCAVKCCVVLCSIVLCFVVL
jgi:hypothetical protein